jgi:hypothetical protein
VTQELLGVNPQAESKNHNQKNEDPISSLNSFYCFLKTHLKTVFCDVFEMIFLEINFLVSLDCFDVLMSKIIF